MPRFVCEINHFIFSCIIKATPDTPALFLGASAAAQQIVGRANVMNSTLVVLVCVAFARKIEHVAAMLIRI